MKSILHLCYISLFAHSIVAQAGIVPASSRVIYAEQSGAQSLLLANSNDYPIIVQTWVDDGSGNLDLAKAPFIVLPAIFKMNPKGIQAIRIVQNGDAMPADRESVYWLNLYEIAGKTPEQSQPVSENQARLDLAMNTQLKIFYRPANLAKMNIEQIAAQLRFSLQQSAGQWFLVCHNPTPYHISFTGLKVIQGHQSRVVEKQMDMMTPAQANRIYPLEKAPQSAEFDRIEFTLLDDQGTMRNGLFDPKMNRTQLK
jgi:P pilus assembly chaperone PapD